MVAPQATSPVVRQAEPFDSSKLPPRPSDLALAKYYDDGIKYENAILKSPQDFEAYLNAGLAWKSLGDLANSAGSGSMVSTAEPLTNELVWYDFSADVYRRATENFDVSATHLVVSQVEPYVFWLNLGNVEKLAKKYNEAESAYRDGVKNFPDEPQLYLALAELYRYNLKKPPSEVIKVYEELIRLYPQEALYKEEISALKEKAR